MTQAIWLIIELVRNIMPILILTKFGDDWIKASKIIDQFEVISIIKGQLLSSDRSDMAGNKTCLR